MKLTITKRYENLKAAHRQWKHDGHCKYVHGENWSFEVTFESDSLDEEGFIVDFGKLRPLKEWLDSMFDHTLLISKSDPELEFFEQMRNKEIADVTLLDDCSAEFLAKFVLEEANKIMKDKYPKDVKQRNLRAVKVVCFEDNKNSATVEI